MATIQELAKQVWDAREVRTRADGGTFEKLRDGSPEWMTTLMLTAHDGGRILLDDWRYACAFAACEAIADTDDGGFDRFERGYDFAADYVDVYTSDLLAWLASASFRMALVDSAADEYGWQGLDTEERIRLGQYTEAVEVFDAVYSFLRERADDDTDDGEPCVCGGTGNHEGQSVESCDECSKGDSL